MIAVQVFTGEDREGGNGVYIRGHHCGGFTGLTGFGGVSGQEPLSWEAALAQKP